MKTYDLARASYWQLRAILFADSDEFVFCPEADKDAHDQVTLSLLTDTVYLIVWYFTDNDTTWGHPRSENTRRR